MLHGTTAEGLGRELDGHVVPGGQGRIKVLVSYPADAKHGGIEDFLAKSFEQVARIANEIVYAPNRSESLAIVIFQTNMGIDEISEVRRIVRLWAEASVAPLPGDNLNWRQRLGYSTRSLGGGVSREKW